MESTASVSQINILAQKLRDNVQQVIVGKDDVIDLMLVALLCKGHALVEDVPGIGKTTLAKALAQSLGCTFKRVQFTPDLTPPDILGVHFYNQKSGEFQFRPGPVFAQILLADEINRATPRTQSSLLEAMQEQQVTLDGENMPLPSPFLVIATQNPIEMEGTFPLPEAQLDRFLVRVRLGYPTQEEESGILLRFQKESQVPSIEPVVTVEELQSMQSSVEDVRVDDSLREYIVQITHASREHSSLQLGASPRAALAHYKASQAIAALSGRDYVLPDDIKQMALHALGHRLIPTSQARLRGRSTDEIVAEILSSVDVPIER